MSRAKRPGSPREQVRRNFARYFSLLVVITTVCFVARWLSTSVEARAAVPNAPAITGVVVSAGSIAVTVTAHGDGGSTITGYRAACASTDGLVTSQSKSSVRMPLKVRVDNAKTYTCTATAKNKVGTSALSSPSARVSMPQPPDAPVVVSVSNNGNRTYVLLGPGGDGGSPITGYRATCTAVDGSARSATSTEPSLKVTVNPGKTYGCVGFAKNDVGLSAPSASFSPPPAPAPKGPGGSWTLEFSDEFDGNTLDPSTWATQSTAEADGGRGNHGNGQLEWNQPQNCSVGNGVLTITAKPDNITSPSGQHYAWSSCLISSTPSFSFQHGFIEERAKLPSNRGFWPAFWTWQAPGNNSNAETDVYEYYSSDHTELHLARTHVGGCTYTPSFDPSAGFHTYGADIEASGTTWYVDGVKACSVSGSPSGPTNIIDDMFVYAPIPPSGNTVEHKLVDYIRAWQR